MFYNFFQLNKQNITDGLHKLQASKFKTRNAIITLVVKFTHEFQYDIFLPYFSSIAFIETKAKATKSDEANIIIVVISFYLIENLANLPISVLSPNFCTASSTKFFTIFQGFL